MADYQTVLRTIRYNNTLTGPGVSSVTVGVVANDGSFTSAEADATITIHAPPFVDLNGSQTGTGFSTLWSNSGPVPITDMVEATISSGADTLSSLTVTLATFHAGDVLAVPILSGININSSYANGTLSLTGSETVAHYQQELRLINYDNTVGGPGVSSFTASVVASDGSQSSAPVTATINTSVLSGQVLGNRLFYNNTHYDGNDAAINASDDLAIASDKIGFNGVGTASFANVSSYAHGITGIMVDLKSGLGTHGNINLASGDITFKVAPSTFDSGTYNNVGSWTTAPAPSAISVRLGAGTGGSDRIEIVWNNDIIENTWLEVDVLASANTGLSSPDVFYFGSAPGDSGRGNPATAAVVNATDITIARANITAPFKDAGLERD